MQIALQDYNNKLFNLRDPYHKLVSLSELKVKFAEFATIKRSADKLITDYQVEEEKIYSNLIAAITSQFQYQWAHELHNYLPECAHDIESNCTKISNEIQKFKIQSKHIPANKAIRALGVVNNHLMNFDLILYKVKKRVEFACQGVWKSLFDQDLETKLSNLERICTSVRESTLSYQTNANKDYRTLFTLPYNIEQFPSPYVDPIKKLFKESKMLHKYCLSNIENPQKIVFAFHILSTKIDEITRLNSTEELDLQNRIKSFIVDNLMHENDRLHQLEFNNPLIQATVEVNDDKTIIDLFQAYKEYADLLGSISKIARKINTLTQEIRIKKYDS